MPEGCPEEMALGSKDLAMLSTQSSQMKPHMSIIPGEAKKGHPFGLPSQPVLLDVLWVQ